MPRLNVVCSQGPSYGKENISLASFALKSNKMTSKADMCHG